MGAFHCRVRRIVCRAVRSGLVLAVSRFDNIHLGLSHEEALRILTLPEDELESASDYYMAASHLINFPGSATENALITLVAGSSEQQAKKLARRKAVEVLGRLKVEASVAVIGTCLSSDDPYLVENAAWSLEQLNCQDHDLHQQMVSLLEDPEQNRRVLIQSLAALHVSDALPAIEALIDNEVPGVRGAARSAVARLSGRFEQVEALEDLLTLPNQMDRHAGIQDVIDCGAAQLLPSVLKAPVSPVFRMRALKALWPDATESFQGLSLTGTLDRLLTDHPDDLVLVHRYDEPQTDDFLIQEFFGTDFSRCYLSLQALRNRPALMLWPRLKQRWQDEAHNDYGAHYFFIRLFAAVQNWPQDALSEIESWLMEAVATKRPQFLKSKPAALLALARLAPERCREHIGDWSDAQTMTFWECRYAAAMVMESLGVAPSQKVDPHPYVEARLVKFRN
jgi:bilin biosynthesis protein